MRRQTDEDKLDFPPCSSLAKSTRRRVDQAQRCMPLCENVCNCTSASKHAQLCTSSFLHAYAVYTRADESDLLETSFWLAYKVISVTTSVSMFKYALAQQASFCTLRQRCIAALLRCLIDCVRDWPGATHIF